MNYESKTIHIYHNNDNNKLKFMYRPVVLSIIKFLKLYNKNIIINYKYKNHNFDNIKTNEILIWVGCNIITDYNKFREKGIYTIYYNTEPMIIKCNSDEIWVYSKMLFNKYIKYGSKQIIKFIPIICETKIPFVPYHLNKDMKLIFFGFFNYRKGKNELLCQNNIIKNNIKEVYDLWNNKEYNNFISEKPNIYLNLNKINEKVIHYILPSVRINKLLSHKCIIISEYTNKIDEELYKDIVYFCNLNEIGELYNKLINKSCYELQKEADEKYKRFYNKFYYKNAIKLITEK